MAHTEQAAFIRTAISRFPEFARVHRILEIGSLNINGSVRSFFEAIEYVGIDIGDGLDVDFRCPGELLELPDGWANIVVSTECFEHASNWKDVLANAIRICRPGGLLLLTFAGLYRSAHGTIDSFDPFSSPSTNSYYSNIDHEMLLGAVRVNEFFTHYGIEGTSRPGDTYFWGIRSDLMDSYVDFDPMKSLADRLARAQSQLGQAMSRLAHANHVIAKMEAANMTIKKK